jgi:anti-sigma regulatory factor (Ser/Thr protein kinase)
VRTGAAAGHDGYFHQTAFYGSDVEFLAVVLPFLRGGVAAGEPTLVALGEANTALLRSAVPDTSGITWLPGADQYARPAGAIRSYREVFGDLTAAGAAQIRVVGDVPHPGTGAPWDWWARYEAAANRTFAEFPLWGLCPYDTRTAPADVLADVAATHPRIATADGRHLSNAGFTDPGAFLADRLTARPLPDLGPAAVDVPDATPPVARRVVRTFAAASSLDADGADDLLLAVSEAVNNAHVHGVPPARLRIWTRPDRVVATVTDRGTGPRDPYVGLVPTTGSASAGLGLWMTHQMCTEVGFHRGPDGFTVRVAVATPTARSGPGDAAGRSRAG